MFLYNTDDGSAGSSGTPPSSGSGTQGDTVTISKAEYDVLKRWEGKHNGLQGFVTTLTKERDEAKQQLAQLQQTSEAEIAPLKAQLDDLNKTLSEKDALVSKLQGDVKLYTENEGLGKLVAEKYPELQQMFNKGLLKHLTNMDEEGRTSYLNELKSSVTTQRQEREQERYEGASPEPPTGTDKYSEMTTQQLGDKLMNMSPDDPEYTNVMERYTSKL